MGVERSNGPEPKPQQPIRHCIRREPGSRESFKKQRDERKTTQKCFIRCIMYCSANYMIYKCTYQYVLYCNTSFHIPAYYYDTHVQNLHHTYVSYA